MQYGAGTVSQHLTSCLPTPSSKAFIITTSSLVSKTNIISDVERLLGERHYAGTYSSIGQHAPIADLDKATEAVTKNEAIDTLISIGGGSPIDSAKAISHRMHERKGKWLYHISIPTTLSAAEVTFAAGFTNESGEKQLLADPEMAPHVIFYDADFVVGKTPLRLWLSTGIRALDHAVELLYHPTAAEAPTHTTALAAAGRLFEYLPKFKEEPGNKDIITVLQLAAFESLGFLGLSIRGGLGLSHALGHALGSRYGIPHGITSCITLSGVVRLKAKDPQSAAQLRRALPLVGVPVTGNNATDASKLADAIDELLAKLDLTSTLGQYNVGEGEVPKIAKATTKSDSGELYDQVSALIKAKF